MDVLMQYKTYLTSIGLMFSKGMGIHGDAFVVQTIGLGALLVGVLIFYVFVRMIFRAMGLLVAFIVLFGILGYILVSMGNITGQSGGVTPSRTKAVAAGQVQMPSGVGNIKKEWDQAVGTISKEFKGIKGMGKILR